MNSNEATRSPSQQPAGEGAVPKKPGQYAKPLSFHLQAEDVAPATQEERHQKVQMRESVTYWQDAMRRFRSNKVAMFCLIIIIFIVLFAYVGPMVTPYAFDEQTRGHERMAPCMEHPFGTDQLGRDMLVRTMVGTQISLLIGVFSAVIVLVVGILYGSIAGFFGGWVDTIMMRVAEVIYSVPDVLVIILLQIGLKPKMQEWFPNSRLGASVISIFIAFALIYWVNMARMVRGQMMQLRENEYVTAAIAMGASSASIIRRHLIPNSVGTIIVTTLFQIPTAIFVEAFLSFIGLGPSAPMASLGSLASSALGGLQTYPYLLFFPAAIISITILAFNQFGDGLRDALDPRLKD